jgi:hypothetical protein
MRMTDTEKHRRIADALRGLWRADQHCVGTSDLAKATGLSAAQVRSVAKAYNGGDGSLVQVGDDRVRIDFLRGKFSLRPAEGWPAYWARQPEAPF